MADADYYQISAVNGTLPDGFAKGLYQEGDSVTLTAAPKPGYIFSCWKSSADEAVGNLPAITVEVGNENAVYTAVFARTDSSIQYELDGGTLPEGYWSKYSPGVAFTLPIPTKSGCVFVSWYTTSDFKETTRISEIPENATGGYKLYAKWKIDRSDEAEQYKALVEAQRTEFDSITGVWDKYPDTTDSSKNPTVYLFRDYTNDMIAAVTANQWYHENEADSIYMHNGGPDAYPTANEHPRLLLKKDNLTLIRKKLKEDDFSNTNFKHYLDTTYIENNCIRPARKTELGCRTR